MPDASFHFRPEDAIGLCLVDIANALSRQCDTMLERSGLTAPQWTVLLNVAGDDNFLDGATRAGGCVYSSEIAAARGLSRPHISATVTELIRKGLLNQQDDPDDRRRKMLTISAEGLAVLRRLQPLRQIINNRLLSDLDPVERTQLLETLTKLRFRARAGEEEIAELSLAD